MIKAALEDPEKYARKAFVVIQALGVLEQAGHVSRAEEVALRWVGR
jgi:hypothetical protein